MFKVLRNSAKTDGIIQYETLCFFAGEFIIFHTLIPIGSPILAVAMSHQLSHLRVVIILVHAWRPRRIRIHTVIVDSMTWMIEFGRDWDEGQVAVVAALL